MNTNVDYATLYFKYPVPTPINGEPTNKTIKRLKQELRANSSSVETDLGGGDHGYLGLYLSDVEYANIIPQPTRFEAPVWPGTLTIDPAATAVEAVHAKEVHHEAMRIYRECKNVEKALLRHTQNALEHKYIEPLLNDDTGLIELDLPAVLKYLDENYGKVPSEEVKNLESEVLSLSFNPADPMVMLYRPIEQLQKLANSAGIPYSLQQQLEIGLTLIRNTRDFEKALGEWNGLRTDSKTWASFKTHFKTAQAELKQIRGPTMQQAGYHHANMLAQQLRTDLQVQGTEMLALVQGLAEANADPPPTEVHPTQAPTANAVIQDAIQMEMLQLLRDIATRNNNNGGRGGRFGRGNRGGRTGRGNGGVNRRTPDNASFNRRVVTFYCHTHGACNHASADCSSKAPGHQDVATMENRMGGSNAFCGE